MLMDSVNTTRSDNPIYQVNNNKTIKQPEQQHDILCATSAEISALENKIFYTKSHKLAGNNDNSQHKPIAKQHLQNQDNFLAFTQTIEFKEILDDVIQDIDRLTKLSMPYVTDNNIFQNNMNTFATKLKNIDDYEQSGIHSLIQFFRSTKEQIKTSIEFLELLTKSGANKPQQLINEDHLKKIVSASIEEGMDLCLAGVNTRLLTLYCGLKNLLGQGELIKEIITNVVSATAQEFRKAEITAGDRLFDEGMDIHINNSYIACVAHEKGIDHLDDPLAKNIVNDSIRKQFINKVNIASSPYNILLTLADNICDKLTNIVECYECQKLFTTGTKDLPGGLITDIDNALSSMLLYNNSTSISSTDILEEDDNFIYSIKDLKAKLNFLIPQKLLGKELHWIVGDISNQDCPSDFEQVIFAIGNNCFGVMNKKDISIVNNEINITFNDYTPAQLKHITPKLITKNNLEKESYRPLIIDLLKNTESAKDILSFFKLDDIKNILQNDPEFSEYLSKIISFKAEKNLELTENLTTLICNEIIEEDQNNKNILSCTFNYNLFMKSKLLESILHKLIDKKIDIINILAGLEISHIVNLVEKNSLKNIVDRALALIGNTDKAKEKLTNSFASIHYKLMQYGDSHIIPVIIATNLINSALGQIITVKKENEVLICAKYKNAEGIKVILQENSRRQPKDKLDINLQNNYCENALMISAKNGDVTTLTEILKDDSIDVNRQQNEDDTALMLATEKGDLKSIEILLKHNADINIQNKYGFTTLMLATQYGHEECVKILLEQGADTRYQEINGFTALMIAIKDDHTACVDILLKHQQDLNLQNISGYTALTVAMQNGRTTCLDKLLNYKPNLELQNKNGYNALMIAAESGDAESLDKLLCHGADVNYTQVDGFTALMIATEKSSIECLERLLKCNVDINHKNEDGFTALMIACQNGYIECLKKLLEHGANVNLENNYGITALDIARANQHKECKDYLKKYKSEQHRTKNCSINKCIIM